MNKKYAIKDGYIVREIAGEYLAVPVKSESGAHIVILNPTGRFLWEHLSNPKNFQELLDAMLKEFENVTPKEAEADLKEFLEELEKSSLLK